MGRTACTEPQCLYKGALYLTFFSTISLDGIYTLSKAYLAGGESLPAPKNSKATYSGASLVAARATQGGQVSSKASDKDRHAGPSGLGAGRGTIVNCLETLTTGKPLPESKPKRQKRKKKLKEDQTIYVE